MTFEEKVGNDLHGYLCAIGETDKKRPECPDVEEKWEQIAKAYLPDGIREFNAYPTVSLGWMMYIGMAIAKQWDTEWEIYSKIADPYIYMRDKRGYDNMDEYIREEVLMLKGDDYTATECLVGECAARTNNMLRRENIEPQHRRFRRICGRTTPALYNGHVCTAETHGLSHGAESIVRKAIKEISERTYP